MRLEERDRDRERNGHRQRLREREGQTDRDAPKLTNCPQEKCQDNDTLNHVDDSDRGSDASAAHYTAPAGLTDKPGRQPCFSS